MAGLLDDTRSAGDRIAGHVVLGPIDAVKHLARTHEVQCGIVAIGDNWQRGAVVRRIAEAHPAFRFVSAIHPAACVARTAQIGRGTVIMAGATLNPGVVVGDFCILNTNASLDHDSRVADYASLAPNTATGGNVSIGAHSAVLIGANVSNGVCIGEHCVIGAGATVLEDLPDLQLAVGTPARAVRSRRPGEPYLK